LKLASKCQGCQNPNIAELIDFGYQPISNRFKPNAYDSENRFPLVLGQCHTCGLIQLVTPIKSGELCPIYDWISYTEPEAHLDELTDIIANLPSISESSSFCGLTFKDASTLTRLNTLGFENTYQLDPQIDFKIDNPNAGIETIQSKINIQTVSNITSLKGEFDVVIVRHVLEHAHDLKSFLASIKLLVKDEGYAIFEVPDCSNSMAICDYTCPWEEHICYFTPNTVQTCLDSSNYIHYESKIYTYQLENSLVHITKPTRQDYSLVMKNNSLINDLSQAQSYANNFEGYQRRISEYLHDYSKNVGRIALFGAGHLASTYINILNVSESIFCVIDDDLNKIGMFMPGNEIPILGSDSLIKNDIKLCMLSLNPEIEERITSRNSAFTEQGGQFASIFPTSKLALNL